jgi:LacI family transcriptional regulator
MRLRVTMADIARKTNTTAATVSRALNGDPSISEKKRAQIVATAAKLQYRPHRIAASLRKGNTGLIGVIIPSAEINFFGSVVHGIERVANEQGYQVLIYQSNEQTASEAKGIETFLSARVDGILLSIAKETKTFDHILKAREAGVPIAFFDRSHDNLGIHAVVIDDFKGGYLATQHLIEQGYQRIAHIAGPQHLRVFSERFRGYKKALSDAGIRYKAEWMYKGNVSIDAGRAAIDHWFDQGNPPDAVFAVEDFTALGAIKGLKERHIRIPTDFGVIGFANEGFGEHITPALSTIDQQTVQMGKEAFRLLFQLIESTDINTPEQTFVLEPHMIIRASSQRR